VVVVVLAVAALVANRKQKTERQKRSKKMSNMKPWQWILIVLAVWQIGIGYFALASARVGLDEPKGKVWNAVKRANELLPRLEDQYLEFARERQLVVETIVEGRKVQVSAADELQSATDDMQRAEETKDLALANQAFGRMDAAIQVIFENYPQLDLSQAQVALMDETSGSISRIANAREQLIEAQTSFNQTRVFYPFMAGMFPAENVMGADSFEDAELLDSSMSPKQ
jgi:hypothetical protein